MKTVVCSLNVQTMRTFGIHVLKRVCKYYDHSRNIWGETGSALYSRPSIINLIKKGTSRILITVHTEIH